MNGCPVIDWYRLIPVTCSIDRPPVPIAGILQYSASHLFLLT